MTSVGLPITDPPTGPLPAARARTSRALPAIVWPIAALAALLLFNLLFTGGKFFHVEVRGGHLYGSLIDVLNRGAPVTLLSLGMTLVIATGGIDLSVGTVMAICGAVAACLIARPDGSPLGFINVHGSLVAILSLSLLAGTVAGLWNGFLVAIVEIQPIVATLILMVAGRGVAQLLTAETLPTLHHPGFAFLGSGFLLGVPFPITVVIVASLLAFAVTRGTALGLFIEAVGNNPTSSRFAGVNATVVKLVVYTLCGLCAGLGGLIVTADNGNADVNNLGLYLELDAILAVAIGGTSLNGGRFSLGGSIIGALLIQTLTTTILTQGIPPAVTLMIKAVVVVMVCLLQSEQFRARLLRFVRRGDMTPGKS